MAGKTKANRDTSALARMETAKPRQIPPGVSEASALTARARDLRADHGRLTPKTRRYLQPTVGNAVGRQASGRFAFSTEFLRNIREKSPLLQGIHQARAFQLGRLSEKWDGNPESVGWRVVYKDHHDDDSDIPEEIKPYIAMATQMLECPSPTECPSMRQLLVQVWDDIATINRPALEVAFSAYDGSKIVGFFPVDGSLIWPTMEYLSHWSAATGRAPTTPDEALLELERACGITELDRCDYVLVRDGMVERAYPPGTIIVAPMVNRTDIKYAGWPPSYVEMSVPSVLANMDAWNYNHNFFTRGMMAEIALFLSGDFDDEAEDALRDQLGEASVGVDRAWSVPLVRAYGNASIEKVDLKKNNTEMGFETWMSLTGVSPMAIYRIDPSALHWKPWSGGASPAMSEANRGTEIKIAAEEGIRGDLQHLIQCVFNPLLQRIHPDLRMEWMYGDRDPKEAAQIDETEGRTNVTINEIRLRRGRRPLLFFLTPEQYEAASPEDRAKHDTNPYNVPNIPGMLQSVQAWVQQQLAPAAQDDGFGEPMAPSPVPPQAPGQPPGGPPGAPGAPGQPPGQPQQPPAQPDGYGGQAPQGQAGAMTKATPIIYVYDTPRRYP